MNKRRVVVTGIGVVSPVGLTTDETWKNILQGKSGVVTIEDFDVQSFTTRIWAPVKKFDVTKYVSPKDARKMDEFIHFGIASAEQAMNDAHLTAEMSDPLRMGVAYGSGIGGLHTIIKSYDQYRNAGPRRVSPFFIPAGIINMVAGHISIRHGLKGPNISVVTACTTGTHNIGSAMRMIQYGDADVMVAGGAEFSSIPISLAGFAAARALSKRNDDPEKASRPWDRDRDGFVLGEGAAALVLEEYEHAMKRGAPIYAEVTGFGMSADAYHITAPDETSEGAAHSMRNAISDANIEPAAIDYINGHGTSTKANDLGETRAIKLAFGDHAYKIAISSTKSMTGHLLGAAGAIEAVFSVLAIRDQIAPPTINLDNPDDECDLDYVPHTAREMEINTVLTNSFGFGGTNGSLIFQKLND